MVATISLNLILDQPVKPKKSPSGVSKQVFEPLLIEMWLENARILRNQNSVTFKQIYFSTKIYKKVKSYFLMVV
jgi:hypothetical protein